LFEKVNLLGVAPMGDRLSLIKERWRLLVEKRERERREIERELMLEKEYNKEVLKAEQVGSKEESVSGGRGENG